MGILLRNRLVTTFLFDFDGTLVDASPAIIGAFNAALARAGLPPAGEDAIRRRIGLPLKEALSPYASGGDLDELVCHYREEFAERSIAGTRLLAGVNALIVRLAAEGTALAVVTSRGSRSTTELLRMFDLDGFFSTIVGADQVVLCKPFPEPVLLALERMAMPAESAALVGDTPLDVEAALNSGVLAVGVGTGSYSCTELQAAGAHLVFEDAASLASAIAGQE